MTRRAASIALALAGALSLTSAAAIAPLVVEVEGVRGELRKNVIEHLDIAAEKKRVSETDARMLHARAEQEIADALEPFGYYRPEIRSEFESRAGRFVARYVIDPGPPLPIDSVDVRIAGEGSDDPYFRRRVERFPLRRGDALRHEAYEEAKSAFMSTAMRHGYIDAHFTDHQLRVDLERYVAEVTLHFETGPQFLFGPVEFRQDVVDPDLLRGYVTFHEGEPLDFNKLLELESALGNSPYFSRVEVRPRRDLAEGAKLPIVVDLVAAKTEKYTLGVGYGTDNGPHASTRVELRRLNRRGHRGEVDGTLSTSEQSGTAKYILPWPYPRTDVLTFTAGYTVMQLPNSDERTGLAGVGLSRLWAGWQETFGLTFRRQTFTVGLDHATSNFLVPEANWSYVRSNDPVAPTDGRRVRLSIQGAHESVLSAASYLRLEAEGKWMRELGRREILIGRATAGQLWTRTFHALPPSARFFAGGAQSVRGYGYQALGSRDVAGNVIGGEVLRVASLELEHRINRTWGAAVFYDVGNATLRWREGLEQGAGVGARWRSPVGIVRVDLGVPLTRTRRHVELHLAIGPGL